MIGSGQIAQRGTQTSDVAVDNSASFPKRQLRNISSQAVGQPATPEVTSYNETGNSLLVCSRCDATVGCYGAARELVPGDDVMRSRDRRATAALPTSPTSLRHQTAATGDAACATHKVLSCAVHCYGRDRN